MKHRSVLILLIAVALGACQPAPASEPTTPRANPTATPTRQPLTLLQTPVMTRTATISPTGTPTPAGPTPTPTNTPEPPASPELLRQASALQERAEQLRQALGAGDTETLLRLQREMAPDLQQAIQLAEQDESEQGKQIADALHALSAGLTGDLPKLDDGRHKLARALGSTADDATDVSTGQAVQPIDDLGQYAANLNDKVAAFEAALQAGRTSDLLRLQGELLTELQRGESLKNSSSKQATTVRSALEDLRSALGGDRAKFASAEAKLQQIAGQSSGNRTDSPAAQPVDLQPIANELNNKLGVLAQSLGDPANKEGAAKARQDLAEQIRKAEAQIERDRSPRAERLRHALGIVREVANGDSAKIDAARSALEDVMNSG